jgi:uncharacterized protein (TIGR02452 family)
MSRSKRSGIAKDTLQILEQGYYILSDSKIDIQEDQSHAVDHTVLYTPEDSDLILSKYQQEDKSLNTIYRVINQTTLDATRDLIAQGIADPFVLNFASAKNPGGGFLGGSQAQEESIARATGLYPCQLKAENYYKTHRGLRTCLYTDTMIYSPQVPILKDEIGDLLPQYVKASILTSAAVNTGVVKRKEPNNITQILPIMRRRIRKVLAVAAEHQHKALVLGAWGCGVFQNDPAEIAQLFAEELNGDFKDQFEQVVFAIYSKNERFIKPFERLFS